MYLTVRGGRRGEGEGERGGRGGEGRRGEERGGRGGEGRGKGRGEGGEERRGEGGEERRGEGRGDHGLMLLHTHQNVHRPDIVAAFCYSIYVAPVLMKIKCVCLRSMYVCTYGWNMLKTLPHMCVLLQTGTRN